MYGTMSDSRDEEFAASAGWLNRFLLRNYFTCRRRTTTELNACPKLPTIVPHLVIYGNYLAVYPVWL